jgi:hypothetical protein
MAIPPGTFPDTPEFAPRHEVMFMSRHTQDGVLKEGVRKGTAFFPEAFYTPGLAQKVRETLDSNARSVGEA